MRTKLLIALGLLWVPVTLTAGDRPLPKEERPNDGRVYGKVVIFRPDVAKVSAGEIGRVQKIYDEWRKTAAADAHVPRKVMIEMYREGDYKTLKTMIENGKISGEHSLSMADLRTAMCLEAIGDVCGQKIEGKQVKVFRSDSGNQRAGMTSDIDQTLFAYVEDGEGGWKRAPELDAVVTKRFNDSFEKRHKITLEKFDIATFPGKDKFPDPRRVSVQIDAEGKTFAKHAGESMASLRLTPGAYTYCGAVVQQMQLRVLDQLHRELGASLSAESKPPRKMNPELHVIVGDSDSRTCDAITANEKGGPAVKPATYQEAIDVMFDGLPPALERGHAYDAAVANYLEFMHHLHDKNPAVKYHLRAGDDGVAMLHLLNEGQKQSYEKLGDAERKTYLEKIIGSDNPAMLERWKDSFDLSAKLRELHNAKALSADNVDLAFKSLAEKLAAGKGDWKSCLPAAREEYNRRCQEFLLHNIVATAKERVLVWVTHDPNDPGKQTEMDKLVDEDRVRKALKLDAPESMGEWLKRKGEIYKNSADIARLQLLYSFRELPPHVVDTILATSKNKVSPADYQKLVSLRTEAKSITFLYKRVTEYPQLYREFLMAYTKQNAEMYRKQFVEHLLTQSGLVAPGEQLKVREMFAAHRVPGIGYRYIRNATLDPGNIDGVMTVLRTYSESRGDPEAYEHAVKSAVINALPIAGQVVGFVEADYKGKAVMIVCTMIPTAGMTMMVVGIGESGLALYEHEYAAPLANATADAIYRGYVGPSLYEFGQAPAQFTDQDKADLERVSREVGNFKDATDKNQQALLAKFKIQEAQLAAKKNAWTSYVSESSKYEGGVITGSGGHLKQARLPGELLFDRVEPLVFFSPKGVVDFGIKPLTEAEENVLATLPKLIDNEPDVLKREDLIGQLEVLKTHQEEFQRAERYRQAAKENHELLLQIRRDSLWPYILKDSSHDLITAAWVRWWIDDHAADLPGRLKQIGVEVGEKIPERVIQDLQDRVREDIQSSRARYERWQMFQKAQEKQQQELVEGRKARYAGEALMEAARQKANELAPVAEAIFLRNMPDSAPQVFIGLREVPGEKEGEREFRPDVRVVANPDIFRPPYSTAAYVLSSNEVAQAVQSRSYQSLPLSNEQIAVLQKASGPAVLVFAFCKDFELPTRNVPETVARLPRLQKVSVRGQSLCLFGGAAFGATVDSPATEPPPPAVAKAPAVEAKQVWVFEKLERLSGPDKVENPRNDWGISHYYRFAMKERTVDIDVYEDNKTSVTDHWGRRQTRLGPLPATLPDDTEFGFWVDQLISSHSNDEAVLIPSLVDVVFTSGTNKTTTAPWVGTGSQRWGHPFGVNLNGDATPEELAEARRVGAPPLRAVTGENGERHVCLTVYKVTYMKFVSEDVAQIVATVKVKRYQKPIVWVFAWTYRRGRVGDTPAAVAAVSPKPPVPSPVVKAAEKPAPTVANVDDLRRAATAGDAAAQSELGKRYMSGIGVAKDYVAAAQWFEKSAALGNLKGLNNLGCAYERGQGVPKDYAKALQLFQQAAARGLVEAQYNLGQMYKNGTGVEKNPVTAFEWYHKSAVGGYSHAQNSVGYRYATGEGVPQNYVEAVKWYRSAAELGNVAATCNLGLMYSLGRGVKQDKTEAARWYRIAAEKGDALAQNYLGELTQAGTGVPKDLAAAARLYELAANHGLAAAQYNLGNLCLTGQGIPANLIQAHAWFNLAAAQGHAKAKQARDEVAQKLSAEQIDKAQSLAKVLVSVSK